ncbi:SH3 domain-containing protein [Streptomyces sp. MMBL 11-1]|uniref:SH3 domain-containing protein n=1 Tax=Streptomyces sp. MMBL 11-1 TaxID=3026420 RepID=UPI002361879A|nr:SH3 domain-containing protein [Streptomyces sp. MMBL 11-1]
MDNITAQRRRHIRDVSPPVRAKAEAFAVPNLDNGINYRTGPSTSYVSKGFLYDGDDLRVYCGKGNWYYTKLIHRSKSGMKKGTYGWVRSDMLLQLAG